MTTRNPFEITKAVDFNDAQINSYFVDLPRQGLIALAKPRSTMPMLIMGGKGSGKTHLMRYFSYPSQKLRHSQDLIAGLRDDGYIGIYLRCSGLNAGRFREKGQTDEVWDTVFAYYMELWLGQLLLTWIHDALQSSTTATTPELLRHAAAECAALLDSSTEQDLSDLAQVAKYFHALQREVDLSVNNVALTRKLDITIRATSGQICFGLPKLLSAAFPELADLTFLYLLDEYENLMERQQRYCNTLLREKHLPSSFKIGGRTYGFKTYGTFSDQEEIKEGSEYEKLSLDSRMRNSARGEYEKFAKALCVNRLTQAGSTNAVSLDEDQAAQFLQNAFAQPSFDGSGADSASFIRKYEGRERPYFDKLRKKLDEGTRSGMAPGVRTSKEIATLIDLLRVHEHPLLEKLNIYSLYRSWRSSEDLTMLAKRIAGEAADFIAGNLKGEYGRRLEKRKNDLHAQLLRDSDGKQLYTGFDTFVHMSEGLPRNLLVTLKSIFNWAVFRGEDPFGSGQISLTSQREGVREASEWFFDDARMPGDQGAIIRAAIKRLATLFREIRYSDKPSEKSVSTFSIDLAACSATAQQVLIAAEKWSLLVKVEEGQKDKNTLRIDEKFFLNSMLAPKWDLPVARGGSLSLSPDDVNCIFDPTHADQFESMQAQRIAAMMAPSFGQRSPGKHLSSSQSALALDHLDE